MQQTVTDRRDLIRPVKARRGRSALWFLGVLTAAARKLLLVQSRRPVQRRGPTPMRDRPGSGALCVALLLLAPPGAAAAGFCVEDADDALWKDCREDVTGVTRRVRVLCPGGPQATLMEVTAVRRLQPGEGRCPGASPARALPGTDGIPRHGEDDAAGAPEATDE